MPKFNPIKVGTIIACTGTKQSRKVVDIELRYNYNDKKYDTIVSIQTPQGVISSLIEIIQQEIEEEWIEVTV